MEKFHKYRASTKHVNVKLHHFRDYATRGEVTILSTGTLNQASDHTTEAVNHITLIGGPARI